MLSFVPRYECNLYCDELCRMNFKQALGFPKCLSKNKLRIQRNVETRKSKQTYQYTDHGPVLVPPRLRQRHARLEKVHRKLPNRSYLFLMSFRIPNPNVHAYCTDFLDFPKAHVMFGIFWYFLCGREGTCFFSSSCWAPISHQKLPLDTKTFASSQGLA